MRLKDPVHILNCILPLWLIATVVFGTNYNTKNLIEDEIRTKRSTPHRPQQGRADRSLLHHQNVIASLNGTNTIFTQRHIPYNQKTGNSSSDAESKFLFTLVQFANEVCTVGGSMGFCITSSECTNFGGSSIGSCKQGFGTCCYKAIKCGESSSMNVTYIQNADYPSSTSSSGSCSHSITRQDNVCHLRLDFDAFELSDPQRANRDATNGHCLNDKMTVSGVSTNSLSYLCGKMPPVWHYYLDVRDVSGPTTFNFALSSGVTQDRKWSIKVTQIDCDRRIPQGCGQYFTGTSGDDIYSFNFGNNGMYLGGMNYAICFRNEKDYCTHSFTDKGGPSFIVCTDSLMIPNANLGTNDIVPASNYGYDSMYCNFISLAVTFRTPVETYNYGPTYIQFWTDQDNANRYFIGQGALTPGFHFSWTHNKCTAPIG